MDTRLRGYDISLMQDKSAKLVKDNFLKQCH